MRSRPLIVLGLLLTAGCRRQSGGSALPPDPPPRLIEAKVRFHQVTLSKFSEHPRLWVYEPVDDHRIHPCIFIAAAGSPLITGMSLSEGDQAEHLPYARAGFTVVAYDVSGQGPPANPITSKLFAKRRLGIDNAKAAIDAALAHEAIDPLRLYAVGHSSAGTLALQIAADDSRIRGCVAFAPVTDEKRWVDMVAMSQVQVNAPDMPALIAQYSPIANVDNLHCPVMLFTANDDQTVATSTVQSYTEKLKAVNPDVSLVTATSGGHYDSMVKKGIPAAIEWLQRSRTK